MGGLILSIVLRAATGFDIRTHCNDWHLLISHHLYGPRADIGILHIDRNIVLGEPHFTQTSRQGSVVKIKVKFCSGLCMPLRVGMLYHQSGVQNERRGFRWCSELYITFDTQKTAVKAGESE